jgi:transposase-like protein
MMRKSPKFSPEVRDRAVRLVAEHQAEYESQWAAIVSIAGKTGATPQTLLNWLRQHERDSGQREGVSTAEAQRIKDLEREVAHGRYPEGTHSHCGCVAGAASL